MVYNARRVTRSSFPDMENNVVGAINRQSIENILSLAQQELLRKTKQTNVLQGGESMIV